MDPLLTLGIWIGFAVLVLGAEMTRCFRRLHTQLENLEAQLNEISRR